MKSVNYYNAFIEVADDCMAVRGEIPRQKGTGKSVPALQYEMIAGSPYRYTQDDVVFGVYAMKNNIDPEDQTARGKFFSKGQPCLRASPLAKRYGWGFHCDEKGKVAIYPVDSETYQKFRNDEGLRRLKAMRTSRKKY